MTMDAYPEDWTTYSIGQIGDPLTCKRILKEQTEESGDVPFYKIGTFGRKADAYISRGLYEDFKSKYSYPKKGDILLSAAGTIGRLVVFDGEDAYFQDSNIVWLGNDETIVLNLYLYWAFQNMKWQSEDGGIVSRLYNNNFKAMQLVVPPLPEQRRIAAALGDMDKLIDNLSKRIEKKKAIKQGAMQELLTGKKRLPGFEGRDDDGVVATQGGDTVCGCDDEGVVATQGADCVTTAPTPSEHGGWPVRTVKSILKIGHGKDYKDLKEGDVPVFGTGGYMCSVDSFLYDGPTVCIGRKGTIDKPFYHEGKIWTVDTLFYTYDFVDADPKFVHYKFLTIDWLGYNAASGVPSLTSQTIEKIELMMPSLPEQRAIAKVLGDMDAEIAKLEAKREKLVGIKKGMMGDLLTGKVRLKGGEE